jgi:(1->4)-alpha-D-glucan 1-alpha-D-glucosylmutase
LPRTLAVATSERAPEKITDTLFKMPRYVPSSTYRLQLHKDFPLPAARDIVPYLAKLGVGAVYTSPYFTAEPGSTHGYDVCNHNEINPELGGPDAHEAFVSTVASHHLGHVVDFVPNHMGIGSCMNPWWRDLLENGPSAAAAMFFDVDWTPLKPELHAKLLLPILGDQYGNVLERGDLQLVFHDGALLVKYFDKELPINPRQAPRVYRAAVEPLTRSLGPDDPQLHEFLSILSSLENMPPYTESDPGRAAERQREKEVARGRLARLVGESSAVRAQIEAAVARVNGQPGQPESFDALHDLLEAQAYRLAYWRTASHEINYRRFFDINTLAGLRVEVPEVFETTHRLLADLLRDNKVTGVRLDHPDGLFDPAHYFDDLQRLTAKLWNCDENSNGDDRRCLYVVAEKILSGPERLPSHWAVHGTTGYNYLNDLNGIFVDGSQAKRMRRIYARLSGRDVRFDDVLYICKRLIMSTAMASELSVLAHMLDRIGEGNRKSRDFTLDSMRDVITEVVACFPVYRTYVDARGWTPEDRAVLEQAVARARRRNPAMESSLFDFFREIMLPREVETEPRPGDRREGYPPASADETRERLRFAMKLQQYTGPVQAKGLEDTAFYRYNLLLSLNEVGGDPATFGRTVERFHEANSRRLADWPYEMLATMTHDTKLGEDVRARINILSELPDEWGREAARWMRLNRSHRMLVDGEPAPDHNDEYRFYQAVVGVWPLSLSGVTTAPAELVERLQGYMLKAVRESKLHTSWITQNDAYEAALQGFVARVLSGAGAHRFLKAMLPFQQRIAELGLLNSLAQTTLKVGSPGVPDFYQGTELWELSLVDPDNRRPVDFTKREELLDEVLATLNEEGPQRAQRVAEYVRSWHDGRIKLAITAAGLRMRRDHPDLFLQGLYLPLETQSVVNGMLVAFTRILDDRAVVFVAPRLSARLPRDGNVVPLGMECWKTSRILLPPVLAGRTFRHALTGAELRPTTTDSEAWLFAGQIFETVPIGMLVATSPAGR